MGLIDTTDKAIRLLLGRRFTSDGITIGQESFTSTLDINSGEVYTDKNLIPTSSLPFSGSSQNGSTHESTLKYWYRQKLTKSNLDSDVWFFVSPAGSDSGITPQLINDNQEVNFISNKYAQSSLANANAEDVTPGYNVIVYKSTSLNSGSLGPSAIVSTNDYQFDYKTGVLQFDENKPASNQYVYITAYQYVGRTLADEDFRNIFSRTGSFYSTTNDIRITGSLSVNFADSADEFVVASASIEQFKINNDGVAVFASQSTEPSFVSGGMYYSSNGAFFLGTTD